MDKVSDWTLWKESLRWKDGLRNREPSGWAENEAHAFRVASRQWQHDFTFEFISEKGMHSDGSKNWELGWVYSIVKGLSLPTSPLPSSWRQPQLPPSPVLVYPSRDLHILKFAYTNTYVYILCVWSTFTQVLTGQAHCRTFWFFFHFTYLLELVHSTWKRVCSFFLFFFLTFT